MGTLLLILYCTAGQEAALQQYHAAHRPRAMRKQVTHIRSIPPRASRLAPKLEAHRPQQQQAVSMRGVARNQRDIPPDGLGRVAVQPPVRKELCVLVHA